MDAPPTPEVEVRAGAGDVRREVESLRWYHTIELPGGIVTPGEYDTREALRRIPFPSSLSGMRCLDVGTHDGFWAFEMERRGATDVLAIDLDDPRQGDFSEPMPVLDPEALANRQARARSFACARAALGSEVERRDQSVYRLDVEEVGRFDFAFIGTLLLHLRDPVAALTAIAWVLKPGGRLLVNDPVLLGMSLRHPRLAVHELQLTPGKPFWWVPNVRGLERCVQKAGFEVTGVGRPYLIPRGPGYDKPRNDLGSRLRTLLHERGMVHAWVSARPNLPIHR
jgi:tRNA (mo5U34)-methyltransferase